MHLVSRTELKFMLDRQEDFLLLNILSSSFFKNCHIPGSRNASVSDPRFVGQVESILGEKGKSYPIVTYCGGFECNASKCAAKLLLERGHTQVSVFEGGMEDWLDAGYPSSGSEALTCEILCSS